MTIDVFDSQIKQNGFVGYGGVCRLPLVYVFLFFLIHRVQGVRFFPSIGSSFIKLVYIWIISSSFGRQEATEIQTPTLNESLNFDNSLQDTNGLKVLLKHILTIKEQNRKILNILEKSKPFKNSDLPDDFKIKLPIESLQDLEELEICLAEEENFNTFKSNCASISNLKDVTQKNNRILRSLLTDNIAKHFNYFGNNWRHDRVSNKRPFN
ncbi:uncharacterized protein LOC126890506 isoform X2 [Diabrotica virgifera virgifera]|uniref:DUF4806 domain-containing protein n=1 Tax=Diabrotica virgifera virgifera TaxID=50390 RepID=A0ABM5KZ39_DIAVI|nr:uncharacterized protein LOC126890506 isoform X2 [Diabrotica virgifera virgifera]